MLIFYLIFSILLISSAAKHIAINSSIKGNDVGLDIIDMVRTHGYPIQEYHLTTPDDYILEIHRIPYGLVKNYNKGKQVILLMHGILGTSADFVTMGPGHALAFILADLNYDVWLGNARGSSYSRKHAYLDPDANKREFWDFSLHEIGYYDLPTIIDFILVMTRVQDLHYVGYSQGCSAFAILMSMKPEYNSKIRLASLMAPAIIMTHTRAVIINTLAFTLEIIRPLFETFGIYEVPFIPFLRKIGIKYCGFPIFRTICVRILGIVVGGTGELTYKEKLPEIFTGLASASLKQFYHFAQLRFKNGFSQYNYGIIKNLLIYDNFMPPLYNLSLITAPVAAYYSQGDAAVDIRDVRTLVKILPNVVSIYQVPANEFDHVDYVFSYNASELVYANLIETMQILNSKY